MRARADRHCAHRVGGLITGGVLFGTSNREEVCGITGCFPVDRTRINAGAMLLAAGAGLAAAGVPAMLGGVLAPQPHMNEPRMVAGIVFLGLAAANGALGITSYVELNQQHLDPGRGMEMLFYALLGVGNLAIGVPLLASGAPAPKQSPLRSPAMANAGYALFATGGAIISATTIWWSTQGDCGDSCFDVHPSGITLVTVGGSILITAIPLVVAGTMRDERSVQAALTLRVGPVSSLIWTVD